MRKLEEQPSPLPKYKQCSRQVPPWHINNLNYDLDKCRIGEEWWRQKDNPQQCFEASRVFISVNSELMEPNTASPYLGHAVVSNNRNWESMYQNLKKAQWNWVMVAKVMTKEGAAVLALTMLYKVLVQKVLLYGSES